jgi:hypothetical protein
MLLPTVRLSAMGFRRRLPHEASSTHQLERISSSQTTSVGTPGVRRPEFDIFDCNDTLDRTACQGWRARSKESPVNRHEKAITTERIFGKSRAIAAHAQGFGGWASVILLCPSMPVAVQEGMASSFRPENGLASSAKRRSRSTLTSTTHRKQAWLAVSQKSARTQVMGNGR